MQLLEHYESVQGGFYGKSIYSCVEKDIFAFKGALGNRSMLVLHTEVTVRSNECFQTKGFIL